MAGVRDRQARPGRGAPRPQAQAERHGPAQGPPGHRREDRRGVRLRGHHGRPAPVRVDRAHRGEGPHVRTRRRAARHLPQAAPGRTADPRGRADAVGELLLQPEALRPGQGRPLQDQQEARPGPGLRQADADDRRRGRRDHLHRRPARRQGRDCVAAWPGGRRVRRHRPLRQPPSPHGRRAHPEPAPHRPRPDGAGRPRADDDSGRRGDHAADADQHPTRRGGAEGVLRHLPAQPVHGPDQPAGRSDAQAASVRARPRWTVP